jgi:hypothetical protein
MLIADSQSNVTIGISCDDSIQLTEMPGKIIKQGFYSTVDDSVVREVCSDIYYTDETIEQTMVSLKSHGSNSLDIDYESISLSLFLLLFFEFIPTY